MYPGTNGQWVRTHNQESVEAFQAEQKMRSEVEREHLERSREFRSRLWDRVRGWFRH